MKTRQDVIEACMRMPGVYEDYPFDDPNWTAMRHASNQKTFAFIYERLGNVWINVKAEPLKADFWRSAYSAVIPAYHMNKRHWNSIILDGNIPEEDVINMIEDSYHLTTGKKRR